MLIKLLLITKNEKVSQKQTTLLKSNQKVQKLLKNVLVQCFQDLVKKNKNQVPKLQSHRQFNNNCKVILLKLMDKKHKQ